MQSFVMLEELLAQVPGPVVTRLARVDAGRGREDLYQAQLPALLTELAVRARVESITASSALEGVAVTDPARAAKVIEGRGRLQDRRQPRRRPGCPRVADGAVHPRPDLADGALRQ